MKRAALSYYVLDVFATQSYKGNPLAVVFTNGDLALTDYENIAREFGYSETSFVYYSAKHKALQVRSFSPTGFEVDGAGHNLLGAVAAALLKPMTVFDEQVAPFSVIMKDNPITVSIDTHDPVLPVVKMLQRPAVKGATLPTDMVAKALGLQTADLSTAHFSPIIVQTEVAHLMVPVRDVATLDAIRTDSKALIAISNQYGFEGYYCFAFSNQDEYLVQTRFFNPLIGIEEDAATGTAAGPLAGILASLQLIQPNRSYHILQGVQLNQPSLIEVAVQDQGILVGGPALITMEGQLYL